MMQRRLTVMLLMMSTCAGFSVASAGPAARFNVKDHGAKADGTTDDAPAIRKAVEEAVKAGPGAVVAIPAGRYRLQTPARDGMIEIRNASGLTVEGEKGTLLVSGDPTKHMVFIGDSADVTVRRLEMDRQPLVFTQGKVVSVDVAGKRVDVAVDQGYDEPDAKYLQRLKSFLVFTDPAADTWDQSRWWPAIVERERTGPMAWRFKLSWEPLAAYAGKRWLLWDNTYKGWGVVVHHSKDCLVEDIQYYGGGADAGMGVWSCSGTITYRRFRVGVPPGSDRLFAAAGGGQEFQNRGTLVLDGCDVSRVDDDGVNMGTTYARVLQQADPRTLVVENSAPFQPGDTIALWDWFLKKGRSEAKLVRSERVDNKSVRLTLDADVKAEHPVGSPGLPDRATWKGGGRFEEHDGVDRVASFEAAGKLVVRNCRFQGMRARNILVKTSDSLIEGCTFYNTHMTAILAGPEFYWGEAPAVRNLVIRNNRFINIDGSSINLGCHASDHSFDNRNIRIEGNTFERYGALGGVGIAGRQGTAVLIRNADGVVIRDNTFGPPASTAPPGAKPLVVEVSRNVSIKGNKGVPDEEIQEAPGGVK